MARFFRPCRPLFLFTRANWLRDALHRITVVSGQLSSRRLLVKPLRKLVITVFWEGLLAAFFFLFLLLRILCVDETYLVDIGLFDGKIYIGRATGIRHIDLFVNAIIKCILAQKIKPIIKHRIKSAAKEQ